MKGFQMGSLNVLLKEPQEKFVEKSIQKITGGISCAIPKKVAAGIPGGIPCEIIPC